MKMPVWTKPAVWGGVFGAVALAKADTNAARMTKHKTETSSYSRSDIVRTSGWATMPGMTAPDYNLATACSDRLTATS